MFHLSFIPGLVKLPGFFVSVCLILWGLTNTKVLASEELTKSESKSKPDLFLLKSYDENINVTGWLMSEKLDGVRAYWDGKQLMSRQGNVFTTPPWFVEKFPPFELDGELWLGRNQFANTNSIVNTITAGERWRGITYQVFEVPNQSGGLLERLSVLKTYLKDDQSRHIQIIPQISILSNQHLQAELDKVLTLGGEGLVVRSTGELYKTGRLSSALKVKKKMDAECVVKDYTQGKGKYQGEVGALVCELIAEQVVRLFPKLISKEPTVIKIGSGLTDRQRKHPPKIGTFITFQYMGLTKTGLPRFPVFLRERLVRP